MDDQSGLEREGWGITAVHMAQSKRSAGTIMVHQSRQEMGFVVREDAHRAHGLNAANP